MNARIGDWNGAPALLVDGKPIAPMQVKVRTHGHAPVQPKNGQWGSDKVLYVPGDETPEQGEKLHLDEEYYRELGKAGVRVFWVICDLEWTRPGAFAQFCEEAETILRAVPDAYIMPTLGLHPPEDWLREHPEECVQYSDGSLRADYLYTESFQANYPAMYSLVSEKWRQKAGEEMEKTLRRMERLPYGDRLLGVSFMGGSTSEWQYRGTSVFPVGDTFSDCGPAFRHYFSGYLKEKYQTVEALRAAWRDPEATFENPPIPNVAQRFFIEDVEKAILNPPRMLATSPAPPPPGNGTQIGAFLDTDRYQAVADYFRAWQVGTADTVIYFARVAKRVWPNRITATCYGSWGCVNFFYSSDTSGTLRILDEGSTDMLIAPGVYQNRQPGGFTGQREMNESFALRGRVYIVSNDSRTHRENAFYRNVVELFTADDAIQTMKRDFGANLAVGNMAYWFDQHVGGGRFKDPAIYPLIAQQQKIARHAYEKDRSGHAEIALVYDEESSHIVSRDTTFDVVEFFRDYELACVGAPVDQIFHNDLSNPNLAHYKVYVFFNVFSLTQAEREAVQARLRMDHATAVWVYASGVVQPDAEKRFDPAHIRELTGIRVRQHAGVLSPKIRFEKDGPLGDGLDPYTLYGSNYRLMQSNTRQTLFNRDSTLYPAFIPDDPDACVLARYCENMEPAVAIKQWEGFTSVFFGPKILHADILREIARYAGCHIYQDSGDVLYAGHGYITLHASSSGEKHLRFPVPCSPWEAYEEKYYGRNISELTVRMHRGQTLMFEIGRE